MVAGSHWWHRESKPGPVFRWEQNDWFVRSGPDSDKTRRKRLLRTLVYVIPRGSWGFFFLWSCNGTSHFSPAGAVARFQLISDSNRENSSDFYGHSFFLHRIVGMYQVYCHFFFLKFIQWNGTFRMLLSVLLLKTSSVQYVYCVH